MKKTFLLLSGLVCALFANADEQVVYSWSSTEGTVSETGGTVTAEHGSETTTYINNCKTVKTYTGSTTTAFYETNYYTLYVCGENNYYQGDAGDKVSYFKFTFDDNLKAGDKILITGFRYKGNTSSADSSTGAALQFVFGTLGSSDTYTINQESGQYWPNLYSQRLRNDYLDDGNEPGTVEIEVPSGAAGKNVLNVSKYSSNSNSSTYLYITEFKVVREATADAVPTEISCTANYINTFCYPYTVSKPSGATFYKFAGTKDGYVYGEEVEGDLVAGYPYIFVPTGSSISLTRTDNTEQYTVAQNSNGLYGNLGAGKTIQGHSYMIFTTAGLVYATTGNYNTVKQYGCYAVASEIPELTESSNAKVHKLLSIESDTETAISSVKAADGQAAPMYSISGQRITSLQKGQMYIVNGKKYIAK